MSLNQDSPMPLRLLLLNPEGSSWEPTYSSFRDLSPRTTLICSSPAFPAHPSEVELLALPDLDDEAEALNGALERQEEEWALVLWAGEVVKSAPKGLFDALDRAENCAFLATVVSPTVTAREVRLVRRDVRFQYPVDPQPLLEAEPLDSGLEIERPLRELSQAEMGVLQRRLGRLPEGHSHRMYHSLEIALAQSRLGEIPGLVGALEEAEGGRLSVVHGDAYFVRFLARLGLGQWEEARADLQRGLDVFPGSPDLAFGEAMIRALEFLEVAEGTRDPSHPFWHQVTATRHMVPRVMEFLASLGLELKGPPQGEGAGG